MNSISQLAFASQNGNKTKACIKRNGQSLFIPKKTSIDYLTETNSLFQVNSTCIAILIGGSSDYRKIGTH